MLLYVINNNNDSLITKTTTTTTGPDGPGADGKLVESVTVTHCCFIFIV